MHKEYTIERISKNKLNDVVYLFESYNDFKTIDFFEKKFDTGFANTSYVGFIAYHRVTKKPAALYVVFPTILSNGVETILAAQSGDTITHPRHTKQGLFLALANKTYLLAYDLGIQIIFGFPNNNSKKGFFKYLKWEKNEDFISYHRKSYVFPLRKVLQKINMYNVYLKFIFLFIKKLETIESSVPENYFYIKKSVDFVNYKQKIYPSFLIKFFGIGFWLKINQSIIIGDLILNKKTSILKFKIILFFLSLLIGENSIYIVVKSNSPLVSFLDQASMNSEFVCLSGYIYLNPKIKKFSIFNTYSDTDTF